MKINCIAIDDEPLALDIIKDYCKKIPFIELMQTFHSPLNALEYLNANKIDVIFLDIQMDDLSGIQFLKILKKKYLVIFTTAYDSYAIAGYELDVIDYLLKPIAFDRFMRAIEKVLEKTQTEKPIPLQNKEIPTQEIENYIFVKTETRLEKVFFDEILYIEGMGDYQKIVTHTKKIMTLQNFKRFEELLPENNFIRVHKSYLVAIDKIESIERNRLKIKDKEISISDTFRKNFFLVLEGKKVV